MNPKDATGRRERTPQTSCKETAVCNILQIHYAGAEGLRTQHVMSKRFKAFTPQRLADERCKKDGNLTECARDDVLPPAFCFQAVFTETLAPVEFQVCLNI